MDRLFNMDSPLMRTLSAVADMIWMSILWVLCSLPVVTIGASTAALYRVMFNKHAEKASGTSVFFHAFQENFKKATIMWMILLVIGLILPFDWYFVFRDTPATLEYIMGAVLLLVTYIVVFTAIYAFPMTAYLENSVKGILKNSLLLGIGNAPYTLLMCLLMLVPAAVFLFLPKAFFLLFPLWFFMWPGLLCYIESYLVEKVFLKHIPKSEADLPAADC